MKMYHENCFREQQNQKTLCNFVGNVYKKPEILVSLSQLTIFMSK